MTIGQQKIPVVHPETFKDTFIIVQHANGKKLIKREDIAKYKFLGLSTRDLNSFTRYFGNGKIATPGIRGKLLFYDLDELLADGQAKEVEIVESRLPDRQRASSFSILRNGKHARRS